MGKDLIEGIVTVAIAIVGIALIAVIVGRGSQTASVITSAGGALSSVLKAATAPASGGSTLF
jgi:hypothetical protein